jgi:hypothetical protein
VRNRKCLPERQRNFADISVNAGTWTCIQKSKRLEPRLFNGQHPLEAKHLAAGSRLSSEKLSLGLLRKVAVLKEWKYRGREKATIELVEYFGRTSRPNTGQHSADVPPRDISEGLIRELPEIRRFRISDRSKLILVKKVCSERTRWWTSVSSGLPHRNHSSYERELFPMSLQETIRHVLSILQPPPTYNTSLR